MRRCETIVRRSCETEKIVQIFFNTLDFDLLFAPRDENDFLKFVSSHLKIIIVSITRFFFFKKPEFQTEPRKEIEIATYKLTTMFLKLSQI